MNKAVNSPGDNKMTVVCIRECEIPGLGAWKVGDIVQDAEKAKQLAEHPNFKISEREGK